MDGQRVDGTVAAAAADLWVSISELARIKGKSKQAISKRVKKFRDAELLTVRTVGTEIKVNVVEYDRAAGENTDPAQALRNPEREILSGEKDASPAEDESPAPKSRGYLLHKETSAAYQAENDRLDLEERLGRICDKTDVEQRTFTVFRRLRDRLLSLPATCAPRVANAEDERAARVIMEEEIRKMLEALSKDLDRSDGEPEDEDESDHGAASIQ